MTAVDLREVLSDVCAGVRKLAELRHIRVMPSLGEEPALISGNRAALHRLFLVLLDNALKYSRNHGDVIVTLERGDGKVSVTVQDFGSGIKSEDLPHIFERFYRADRARTDGGSGLGLSLADSIGRAHGARIEVRSEEGAWTLFRVSFASRERPLTEANRTSPAGVTR